MLRLITGTVVVASLFSSVAFGRSLQCNREQTKCLTESSNLTIGDQVGIFNDDGELVATGEVKSMRGERRAVLINQRHGTIRKGYDLALLEQNTSDAATLGNSYKVYREPGKMTIGTSLGFSTVSVGEGSPATEVSGYGQWRKWKDLLIIGRGTYSMMEGNVTHDTGYGYESLPISMSAIGALGGLAYIVRENKPVSFRGEAAIGAMYISANVDGDSGLVDDGSTNSKVKNGVAPAGRWSLGVMWNVGGGDWHGHADFAQSLVHEAFANTIALGVSKDMK